MKTATLLHLSRKNIFCEDLPTTTTTKIRIAAVEKIHLEKSFSHLHEGLWDTLKIIDNYIEKEIIL